METIFVTAYDNYAIKALNQSAAYYLLKPIDIDELVAAVSKISEDKRKGEDYLQHAKILLDNLKQKDQLPPSYYFLLWKVLKSSNLVKSFTVKAENNLTEFHLTDGRKLLICKTLKYFDEMLTSYHFVRIHRSHLVNMEYVKRYHKGKGGYVTLANEVQLEVAPKKKQELLERLLDNKEVTLFRH